MTFRIDPIGPRPTPEPVLRVEREHAVNEREHPSDEQRKRRRRPAKPPVPSSDPEPGHVDIRA